MRMKEFALVVLSCCCRYVHAAPRTSSSPSSFLEDVQTGPIVDAKCNMEDLEQANDSQLHTILEELRSTEFFKIFEVDLDQTCQVWKDEEEEEFECASTATETVDSLFGEPAEEAEPLCTVHSHDDTDPFPTSPLADDSANDAKKTSSSGLAYSFFGSNALTAISSVGFSSQAQQDTFEWEQQTDMVVEQDCQEDFWVDMCVNIRQGSGTKKVNLLLNPEHNTGYNGTHIWKAIYEENCIAKEESDEMCFEERVLYRLLSGLHTSTTLSIAKNYHPPSKRKNRETWQPNANYFMEKLGGHPDYIRNLHFSYVVMLRALTKISPVLYDYEIQTGNIVEDETATVLLKRLLDSAILTSCSTVFSAFDESTMFQNKDGSDISLQQHFKGVFHNVSTILDCVQCQQCKLHGKMSMLGYGTALKILFRTKQVPLERNELVAFINTIAKFSENIREVRELTHLYWEEQQEEQRRLELEEDYRTVDPPLVNVPSHTFDSLDSVDVAVGLIAALGRDQRISFDREREMIDMALSRHPELLILARHYQVDLDKFDHLTRALALVGGSSTTPQPDAIVVGSGLAGLAATLNILDRGGTVVIVEKEHLLGGNSNKASSGINAAVPFEEDLETFRNDTTRSAGASANSELIDTLVKNSAAAVTWLRERVGVDLSLLAQLGGHSTKRTHRPSNGMVGAEIIYGMQKAVRKYEKTGQVTILLDSRVTQLLTEGSRVVGVQYEKDDLVNELQADNVILATGGFAADRSAGSYLEQYRPELLKMPATAGNFSTGDGITLATSLGAGTIDMDKVQVHPTGWVDPSDPDNKSKILAAELMRGVGGILLNSKGKRFCNELGTRAYVTNQMLSQDETYAKTGKWDAKLEVPTFFLVLSSSAADDARKHVDLYSHKGLMRKFDGISELASWMKLPVKTVKSALQEYQRAASKGEDEFGKVSFRGIPQDDLENESFYAGIVTPVLHYCMGGITIDASGSVIDKDGNVIPGLHAAGEVSGGVHGANRLAGNSLLECTVFGTIVGKKIPVKRATQFAAPGKAEQKSKSEPKETRVVTKEELEKHNTPDDCWVAIHGTVYDMTEFAEEHPAGSQSIYDLAGKDGSEAFAAVHNSGMLEDFEDDRVGVLR